MNETTKKAMELMIDLYKGDSKRINHFIKVYAYASFIGTAEGIGEKTLLTLELSAIVHDIGIHESERKYKSCSGKYQQLEGPPLAQKLLKDVLTDDDMIDRICRLVSIHHTYNLNEGIDYQILLEADFIVNAFEDGLSKEAVKAGADKFFKTETGKSLIYSVFNM